jgi:peroxiredoxin family protein
LLTYYLFKVNQVNQSSKLKGEIKMAHSTEVTHTTQMIQGYKVTVFYTMDGMQLFVTDAEGYQVYAHRMTGDPIARAREIIAAELGESVKPTAAERFEAAKAKTLEIFNSRHVKAVEVSLEESFGNVRIYSAITRETGVPHRYTVRVEDSFENGETITEARCNCLGFAAKARCRHTAMVAQTDGRQAKREVYPFAFINYSAHKRAA